MQKTLREWLRCKHKRVEAIGYVLCSSLKEDYRAYDGYCVDCEKEVNGSRFSKKWVSPEEHSVVLGVVNKLPLSDILRIGWVN